MSLTFKAPPTAQRHWLLHLWPLALVLLLIALATSALIHYWPQLLMASVSWQRELNQQLSALLEQVQSAPREAGLALLWLSLFYGVLHAVGPGHGKMVITTYLATHPTQLKNSLKLTLLASVVQGTVAIVLVTLVLGVLQLSTRHLHQSNFWLEKGSFILVMLLGALLCWRALKRLWVAIKALRPVPIKFRSLRPLAADHQHDEHCGCGHQHLPSAEQLQNSNDWRTQLAVVLAMGMRPCSGAIMVLVFAKVIGVYLWGMSAAIAMAVGTSLTISLLALLVHYSRQLAVRLSHSSTPAAWRSIAWGSLALAGGLVLIAGGVLLYLSAQSGITEARNPFTG